MVTRFFIVLAFLTVPAAATQTSEKIQVSTPEVGVISEATMGSKIYEYSNYRVVTEQVARPSAELTKGWIGWRATIPAGAKLLLVPAKNTLKACSTENFGMSTMGGVSRPACAYDDNRDGTFDRISVQGGSAGKIESTPYRLENVQETAPGDGFKNVLIFTGFSGKTLKLSYREFQNDFARPAFTQDLEFDTSTLPTDIAVKDVKLRIIEVSNLGLKFERLSQ
jgi:hypothetical protein